MLDLLLDNAGSVLILVFSLLLLCLIPIIWEIWKMMRDIRLVTDRIEMLTDVRGWLSFIHKFRRQDRKRRCDG